MTSRQAFLEKLTSRLKGFDGAERVIGRIAALLDDRVEMGMTEDEAMAALGDVDALIRDNDPGAALVPAKGSADYGGDIREVRLHVKNADAVIKAGFLPDDMTARIEASACDVFTWSLEAGVLTVREAETPRRGLFRREHSVTLTLDNCAPEKLIADSYGGDIRVENLSLSEMAVLASSSGDIELGRVKVGGRTEVTTRSGDMRLEDVDVDGDCKLEAMSGDVEFMRLTVKSLRLRSASGDVDGDMLRANTAAMGAISGDIEVRAARAAASLLCETADGDIDLDAVETPDLRASTGSGDISLRLPASAVGYDIQARTGGDLELPEQGCILEDAPRVTAVSTSGDIEIKL